MTQSEQVEIIRKKIKFEEEILDEKIKLRNEARKEFESCSCQVIHEKRSILDMRLAAVSNQYMCLCGVLELSYELNLISKDEYSKLQKQSFDKVFK